MEWLTFGILSNCHFNHSCGLQEREKRSMDTFSRIPEDPYRVRIQPGMLWVCTHMHLPVGAQISPVWFLRCHLPVFFETGSLTGQGFSNQAMLASQAPSIHSSLPTQANTHTHPGSSHPIAAPWVLGIELRSSFQGKHPRIISLPSILEYSLTMLSCEFPLQTWEDVNSRRLTVRVETGPWAVPFFLPHHPRIALEYISFFFFFSLPPDSARQKENAQRNIKKKKKSGY